MFLGGGGAIGGGGGGGGVVSPCPVVSGARVGCLCRPVRSVRSSQLCVRSPIPVLFVRVELVVLREEEEVAVGPSFVQSPVVGPQRVGFGEFVADPRRAPPLGVPLACVALVLGDRA